MWLSNQQILDMQQRYRVNFINSLSGFKSANLVGTSDEKGRQNLAIISSVFHLGADPALMGFVNRPDSVDRHTLNNIRETKQYTINSVSREIFKKAHQTSARYATDQSEFEHVGLTPIQTEAISAPYVEQSQLRIGLELVDESKLKVNGAHIVVGLITQVYVPDFILAKDGYIDIEQLNTVMVSGLDNYHTSERLARLSYAKVGKPVNEI